MRVALAILIAMPALASATPNTIGASVGVASGADSGVATTSTLDVFGRFGLTRRIGLQAQLERVAATDADDSSIRTFTLAATVDLATTGRWIPFALAGAGFDWLGEGPQSGLHVELGAGYEFRSDGGLTLGIDVRLGDRSVSQPPQVAEPLSNGGAPFIPINPDPGGTMSSGAYTSARFYGGFHF